MEGDSMVSTEFMRGVAETDRQRENIAKVDKVSELFIKNRGIMAGTLDEDRTTLVSQGVLDIFKPTIYSSVAQMKELSLVGTDKQKPLASDNLNVLGEAYCMAVNFSYFNMANPNALAMDTLTAEEIDSALSNELRGIGGKAVEAYSRINTADREVMLKINGWVAEILGTNSNDAKKMLRKELKNSTNSSVSRRYCEMAIKSLYGEEHEGYKESRVGPRARMNEEGEYEGYEPAWVVSEEKFAEALGAMADDLRWCNWTPPEWFGGQKTELEQRRIQTMVIINDGASWLRKFQNGDLEKCRLNPMYTELSQKRFSELFNKDFTLAMSKMLNDLTEQYTNKDGVKMLRYKEKFYKKYDDKNKVAGEYPDKDKKFVYDKPLDIPGTKKIEVADTIENQDKGIRIIDDEVAERLKYIVTYKADLAKFLAGSERQLSSEDVMNANTAWNLFFMMGDSSFADRLRLLSPAAGIISDKLRTLNAEAKAGKKWRMLDKLQPMDQKWLYRSEWFGGSIAKYVSKVATLERNLGRAIDQKTGKTLQEKIANGDIEFFSNVTCLGLLDLVGGDQLENKYKRIGRHGEVELIKDSEKTTLAEMLLNYGRYDEETGKFIRTGLSFDFGKGEVDTKFMADFRDMQEAAVRCFNVATGKVPAGKDVEAWVNEVRSAIGLANQIDLHGDGRRIFGYTRRPELWGMMILNSFGIDLSRLSTDCVYMKTEGSVDYGVQIKKLLNDTLALDDSEVPIKNLLKYLGYSVKRDSRSFLDSRDTEIQREKDRKHTQKLTQESEEIASSFTIDVLDEYLTPEQIGENKQLAELNKNYLRARKVEDEISQNRLRHAINNIRR